MPARRILSDYEEEYGMDVSGISRKQFDEAAALDYLDLKCPCKNNFQTRRCDLIQRFRRGNELLCLSCVNRHNRLTKVEEEG